jgi:hypothetical protein
MEPGDCGFLATGASFEVWEPGSNREDSRNQVFRKPQCIGTDSTQTVCRPSTAVFQSVSADVPAGHPEVPSVRIRTSIVYSCSALLSSS